MNKFNINTPITAKTTLDNAAKWLNIIRYGESGIVIQIQDDCEYRVSQIINNPKILKHFLGPFYKKYLLVHVPVDRKSIDQTIKDALIDKWHQEINKKSNLKDLSTEQILHLIAKEGYEVGLFMSRITHLLQKRQFQPFFDLENLVSSTKNLSVILFSEIDITHSSFNILADKCSLFYDHIIKYPMYQSKDVYHFIRFYCKKWNLHLETNTIKRISDQCGGYLWLTHQALRNLRDNPQYSLREALSNEVITKKIETVWSKFSEKEQEILKKTYLNTLEHINTTTHEYNYLLSINVLDKKKDKTFLNIPILKQAITKNELKSDINLKKDKILVLGMDKTDCFTSQEKKLLSLLLKNRKVVVKRDKIAQTIWADKWEKKYSDWAIDRLLFRLRKKLEKLNLQPSLLKTIKKQGVVFR